MKLSAALLGAAMLMAAQASADVLHGTCSYPAPSCVDDGSITPIANTSPTFSFTKSPDSGSGDFWLTVLIPNDVANADTQSITINGLNTGNAMATGSLVGSGWSSGFLNAYLGIDSSPANPIGAFLPLTQLQSAGATGYEVYQFDFGAVTYGIAAPPTFSESYVFPAGSVILAFFEETGATPSSFSTLGFGGCYGGGRSGGHSGGGSCSPPPPDCVSSRDDEGDIHSLSGGDKDKKKKKKKKDDSPPKCEWHATANSGALIIIDDGEENPPEVPEPATLALVAAGLGGLFLARRRRRTPSA